MKLELSEDKRYLNITSIESYDELEQLKYSLTKKVKGYRFIPSVKNGLWDGSVCFLENDTKIKSGLWKEVYSILTKFNYKCSLKGVKELADTGLSMSAFKEFCLDTLKDHKLTPRDYQIESAYKILKYRRNISVLGTSAGKTLITYLTLGYGLHNGLMKNVLMIVPNVSLVVQANNDFLDYNFKNENLKLKIQQIYSGQERSMGANVTIGTYQSLVKLKQDFFDKFDTVLIDETHKAKAVSITKIMDKLWHCKYRFGLTGTLPSDKTADYFTIMSQTGPVVNNYNSEFLMKGDFITPVKVTVIRMDYAPQDVKEGFCSLGKKLEPSQLFLEEKKYVAASKKRLKFVTSLINKSKKNSLVLFHLIDHGKALYEALVEKRGKVNVFYVDGKVKAEDRELIKKMMEQGTGKLLVASYGTFSTGVSIKNLHNLFLTESFKSDIIIKQSIGRGLRKHGDKEILNVIDFADDFSYTTGYGYKYSNFILKHAKERIRIYKTEGFPYTVKTVKL